MNVHFFFRQSFFRQIFGFRPRVVATTVCTTGLVARTLFWCTRTLCIHPHIFIRVTFTHGSSACKGSLHMCHPSPSRLLPSDVTHRCCSRTVTSRPLPTTTSLTIPSTRSCRTYLSQKRRTFATWPDQMQTQDVERLALENPRFTGVPRVQQTLKLDGHGTSGRDIRLGRTRVGQQQWHSPVDLTSNDPRQHCD